eukprot:Gb_31407 [translate_table: standard]
MAANTSQTLIFQLPSQHCKQSAKNFLKRRSEIDLEDLFLDADSHQKDLYMLNFFLQENASVCDTPSEQLARHSLLLAGNHVADHDDVAIKATRNQRIVFSEQLRRRRVGQLFAALESLLPIPANKVARYGLIEETCKYIHNLHSQLQELKKHRAQLLAKKEMHEKLNHSTNVKARVEIYGREGIIITITSSRNPRYLWRIYEEIEAYDVDIQSADVYTGDSIVFLYFHASCSAEAWKQLIQRRQSLENNLQNLY